ncbi:MAG: hypothetical protein WD273_13915 [Trueperaceae bacterium]
MSPEQEIPQPPEAPQIERRINLSRDQLIGIPILVLIPLLALFGVFGVSESRGTREGESVALAVEYSSRTRLRAAHSLVIEVTNRLDRPLTGVVVEVDRNYVEKFSQATFTPSASTVNETAYRVDLDPIPASATRVVTVDLKPVRYWSHSGTVTVSATESNEVEFEFATFVFP